MDWIKKGNNLAYPFHWQEGAETEKKTYESLSINPIESHFIEFIFFPWATLIDSITKKEIYKIKLLEGVLKQIPPKMKLRRVIFCQHIYLEEIIHILLKLNITDIFWSHCEKNIYEFENITLHSYPLYPYSYNLKSSSDFIPLSKRKYLYSFIGTYEKDLYISDIRSEIFSLPINEKIYIKQTKRWHFEEWIYQCQILGYEITAESQNQFILDTNTFIEVMQDTTFSLCPSGSGPNTIRLWESIAFGAIPIVISDKWRKPEITDYLENIIEVPENINSLKTLLQSIDHNPNHFINNINVANSGEFIFSEYIDKIIKKCLDKYII